MNRTKASQVVGGVPSLPGKEGLVGQVLAKLSDAAGDYAWVELGSLPASYDKIVDGSSTVIATPTNINVSVNGVPSAIFLENDIVLQNLNGFVVSQQGQGGLLNSDPAPSLSPLDPATDVNIPHSWTISQIQSAANDGTKQPIVEYPVPTYALELATHHADVVDMETRGYAYSALIDTYYPGPTAGTTTDLRIVSYAGDDNEGQVGNPTILISVGGFNWIEMTSDLLPATTDTGIMSLSSLPTDYLNQDLNRTYLLGMSNRYFLTDEVDTPCKIGYTLGSSIDIGAGTWPTLEATIPAVVQNQFISKMVSGFRPIIGQDPSPVAIAVGGGDASVFGFPGFAIYADNENKVTTPGDNWTGGELPFDDPNWQQKVGPRALAYGEQDLGSGVEHAFVGVSEVYNFKSVDGGRTWIKGISSLPPPLNAKEQFYPITGANRLAFGDNKWVFAGQNHIAISTDGLDFGASIQVTNSATELEGYSICGIVYAKEFELFVYTVSTASPIGFVGTTETYFATAPASDPADMTLRKQTAFLSGNTPLLAGMNRVPYSGQAPAWRSKYTYWYGPVMGIAYGNGSLMVSGVGGKEEGGSGLHGAKHDGRVVTTPKVSW